MSNIQPASQALEALPTLLGTEHPASLLFRLCSSLEMEGAPCQSSKLQLWLTQVGRQSSAQPAERDGAPLPPLLPASTLRQDFL